MLKDKKKPPEISGGFLFKKNVLVYILRFTNSSWGGSNGPLGR